MLLRWGLLGRGCGVETVESYDLSWLYFKTVLLSFPPALCSLGLFMTTSIPPTDSPFAIQLTVLQGPLPGLP